MTPAAPPPGTSGTTLSPAAQPASFPGNPPLTVPDLLQECGGTGSSRGHCTEGGGPGAMKHEPFAWILAAWWVLFLLSLLSVFTGSVNG